MSDELSNVNISLEQICAAILSTTGPLSIKFNTLLTDYSAKNISVTPNPDSDDILFELVDAPAQEEQKDDV